jgi:uncharacterized protein with NAD-binding domain and iron-sulfur cluster
MNNRVLVLGGGVAGLSAAHELVERKFEVTIIESSDDVGGRARSRTIEGLPTEHGFHFFPAFYRHLIDTLRRIPSNEGTLPPRSIADDLVASSRVIMARDSQTELDFNLDLQSLTDVVALGKSFAALGLKPSEVLLATRKLTELITAFATRNDDALENVTWWDFVEAGSQSAVYQQYFGDVAVRWTVAMDPRRASARTIGRVALQFWRTTVAPVKANGHTVASVGRVLNGTTSEAWLEPWKRHLQHRLGVAILRASVVAINSKDGKAQSVVLDRNVQRVKPLPFAPGDRQAHLGDPTKTLNLLDANRHYDYCLCALPIGPLVDILDTEVHVTGVIRLLGDPNFAGNHRTENELAAALDRVGETIHEKSVKEAFDRQKEILRQRLSDRRACSKKVTVSDIATGHQEVTYAIDVSTTGMRVKMTNPALAGADVLMEIEGAGKRDARIVWSASGFAGARFHETLPGDLVERLVVVDDAPAEEARVAACARQVEHLIERVRQSRTSLEAAVPSLRGLRDLKRSMGWMVGLQFFLDRDVPIARGGVMLRDSPWALTAVSQVQYWSQKDFTYTPDARARNRIRTPPGKPPIAAGTKINGVLSVIISNWDERGHFLDLTAKECDPDQLFHEVWSELKAHLNNQPNGFGEGREPVLKEESLKGWYCSIERRGERWENPEPLFINTVGSLSRRPDAVTNAPNFYLAGDYIKTDTDFASMEAANESARRAVNGILADAKSPEAPCQLWPLELQLGQMGLASARRALETAQSVTSNFVSQTSNLFKSFRGFRGF